MYYILYKPRNTDEPWTELPGTRSYPKAREKVKELTAETNEDGSKTYDVKLCRFKGRDRVDLLRL